MCTLLKTSPLPSNHYEAQGYFLIRPAELTGVCDQTPQLCPALSAPTHEQRAPTLLAKEAFQMEEPAL